MHLSRFLLTFMKSKGFETITSDRLQNQRRIFTSSIVKPYTQRRRGSSRMIYAIDQRIFVRFYVAPQRLDAESPRASVVTYINHVFLVCTVDLEF